ncbi:VOC family protein [Parendozoicomonas haliclonae]|uniref:Glyoxalase-like domain protein n=1 Tax=Parendozoicomonas haliclonae TaxID=1960125 RepID=A0A1X7AGE8_9GAMM|nr:VOC family protein [Parendozoicomonas haliclonae]SMA38628.1 Glyoxalase-like domain protein [Parendozoicomonas haliclonae]
MISHIMLPVSNYQKSKEFYSKALAPVGYSSDTDYGDSCGFNDGTSVDFWIAQKETVVPMHVAFKAGSKQAVEGFYEAAVNAGGTDNGKPGYRDYGPGYYAAFAFDPDGHNIEANWIDTSKAE